MADTPEVQLALIQADISRIKSDVGEIKHTVNDQAQLFITRAEFTAKLAEINATYGPSRVLSFGLAGLLLTAVIGAIVSQVLIK